MAITPFYQPESGLSQMQGGANFLASLMQNSNQIKAGKIQNALHQLQLDNAPTDIDLGNQYKRGQISGQELMNQLKQLEVGHKPKEYQLADALRNAQINDQYAMTRYHNANTGLVGVNTDIARANLGFLPERQQLEILKAQAQAQKDQRTGQMQDVSAFSKLYGTLDPATQAQFMADPKNAWMLNAINQYGQRAAMGAGVMPPGMSSPPQNALAQSSMGMPAIGQNALAQQADMGRMPQNALAQMGAQGMPPQPAGLDPEQIERLQKSAQMTALMKNANPTMLNQYLSGHNLETTLNSINQDVFSRYAGPGGNARLLSDFKNKSPEYNDFMTAVRAQIPLAAGQIRKFLGEGASEKTIEELQSIMRPDHWRSNPEQALQQWQAINNVFRNELKNTQQAITNPGFYTQSLEEAEESPRQTQKMGDSQAPNMPKIPSFSSRDEALNWLKSLPPAQRAAIAAQMQGGR